MAHQPSQTTHHVSSQANTTTGNLDAAAIPWITPKAGLTLQQTISMRVRQERPEARKYVHACVFCCVACCVAECRSCGRGCGVAWHRCPPKEGGMIGKLGFCADPLFYMYFGENCWH